MRAINLGVRLDPAELAAIRQAAADEDRTMSALLRKITVEWLRDRAYLELPKRETG